MAFFLKELGEMTGVEFYQLARLRTAVFVVEQACAYQEIDAIDAQAKHLWADRFVRPYFPAGTNGAFWSGHCGTSIPRAKRRPSSDQRSFASH